MFAKPMTMKTTLRAALVLGVTLVSLTACAAQYRKHGWVPSQDMLNEVVVGIDTRDSVAETIGEPVMGSLVDESGYYYMTTRMKFFGPREPEIVSRELVAVTFDGNGVVDGIRRYGLEDGQVVMLDRRVTSSSIDDKTFLRQLLGNLGQIDPSNFLGN